MGYTRKLLSSKNVPNTPVFYTQSFRLDLAESFHFHYRNFRVEMAPSEWVYVCKGFFTTWLTWWLLGKPTVRPEDRHLKFANTEDLSPEIGDGYKSVRGDELAIELQNQADYIHLHYRGSRIEFSLAEFRTFADAVQNANNELLVEKVYEECPRRVGLNHIIQVRGRVEKHNNPQNFLIGDEFMPADAGYTRNSVIFDKETNQWKQQNDVAFEDPLSQNTPGLLAIPTTILVIIADTIGSIVGKRETNPTYRTYLKDLIRVNLIGETLFQKIKAFRTKLRANA